MELFHPSKHQLIVEETLQAHRNQCHP